MTAHTCRTLTPGCYRCELNVDEVNSALAEDYFDVMLAPGQRRWGFPEEVIDRFRLDYIRDATRNPAAVAELHAWHARRELADVDSMAAHAWNVRDVFTSNA